MRRNLQMQTAGKLPRSLVGAALLAALVIIPALAFSSADPAASIRFVAPDWVAAHARDSGLRILDVRNAPLEYIAGHVPGAVNIADIAFRGPDGFLPVQYWEPDQLGRIFARAGVSDGSKVLVYSDGNDVLGATMVAYLLERAGVREIAVLDGGYAGYRKSGQPVTKEFPL